ncbi:conserved hypothetical protein [Leishmania major strain Friedlin]|uniref:Uncharacterized protein n=1 Tax=Leishmania major TaxID=5664 RepID=Q4Q6F4_LEIMA|nr:conserved hypothetical protein [Leishmania major strain Friedlin]CAG9579272.1 hypothetical_protein_-_conserved [Leishmania major strain Friedlin]CAJ08296.1 conserved hypothetical protein [Leishmania major strain Friedlin]|eukprot:XP_001685094.1 conserved hypothetical protein [Leishmania major strain Friedlin]
MEYVSFLDASAATLQAADRLSPVRGRPAEDEAEEDDSGLLSSNQLSTSLNPFVGTAAFTNTQNVYWAKSAGLGMPDNPKKQHSTVCGASLAGATPMYTEVSQRQLTSQFASISLTEENWCASVIAENNVSARDGGARQTVVKAARIPSCPPRSHLQPKPQIRSPISPSTPEGRRRENKTGEFFRLAHELKKQRRRLREQQQQQQQQQQQRRRWQQTEKWYRGVAKPHTYLRGDSFSTAPRASVEVVAPASATGSVRAGYDGDEDAVATFHNPPTQPPVNAPRGSGILSSMRGLHRETLLQKKGVPLFLRQTQPLPQTPLQKADGRGRSQRNLRALLPTVPMRHGWGAEGFSYSPPTTQLCRDAYSSDSDVPDSSSASISESLLSRQSERMGVFPALDFPHVRSPDWATLNSMECDASESRLSVPSASEEATGSDQTCVLTDVARNVVPLEVVPPLPNTTMPPTRSNARNFDYHGMRAAARALSPNRPPVWVSAPTTRAARVPLWGVPPPVAAATPNSRARKGLLPSTLCLTKGSRFTFSADSSSAQSSGSPASPDRSLSTSNSRRDNSTVRPLQRQRKNGSSGVPRGDEAVRGDVSTHSTRTGGAQGHINTFATAPGAMLPRKAVMQRFCERFAALKHMLCMKPLE